MLGLSHFEVALAAQVQVAQLQQFEAGSGGLTEAQVRVLAEELEVPFSEFWDPPLR